MGARMRALAVAIVAALCTAPVAVAGVDWNHLRDSHVLQAMHGRASYYAARFEGRRTASGERYDASALTAAHRTLPIGTRVRVIDNASRREVVVRINDRGPFARGRTIDLSRRAAQVLGITHAGVADVTLEVLSLPRGDA
jgi:rare lipoprotein A